jgi:hypothetical protein
MSDAQRYRAALAAIDEANARDPHREIWQEQEYPAALLYSIRMSETLEAFDPGAPEHVRIAARAQHIRRWEVPRSSYPMDRTGYLKWRTDLGRFHADVTGEIMRAAGYDEATIERAEQMLTKKQIKANPDTQLLEDVICLTFLRWYFDAFAAQHAHGEEKIIHILQRTWKKMSDAGHEAALKLPLSDRTKELVGKALGA